MLCEKPYMMGALPCPCMKCLPCRISRRRVWAHRMMLESLCHGDSCFVTLTYDDVNLPSSWSLVPKDAQLWLKRLRKVISPLRVRFFLAGEYGQESLRPHYHAAVFGLPQDLAGGIDGQAGVVQDTWAKGFTYVGSLTPESASYIAGYVSKKMLSWEDSRLDGRLREFTRMSLRPGIGALAMDEVSRALESDVGLDSVFAAGDVPSSLSHGKRAMSLGRYLRRVIRGKLGFASKDTPPEATRMYVMRLLDEAIAARATNPKMKNKYGAKIVVDMALQKRRNLLSRFQVHNARRAL